MFNISKIQDAFVDLVGLRVPPNPEYNQVNAFTSSDSGLFVDDVEHFKVEFFVKSQDYAGATSGDLNAKMLQIYNSAISSVLHQAFTKPSFIDRNRLFSHTYDTNESVTQNGDEQTFYGYEIKVSDKKNIAFKITKAIIEMTRTADAGLTLQVYHSSLIVPLYSEVISIVNATDDLIKIVDLNWVIDAVDLPYKGSFFVGYFRPANTLKPIKREFNRANEMNTFSELSIERMQIQNNFRNLENIESADDHNGVNLDITVYDDYTDLIIQNKFLFARAIQLQWAMTVMLGYVNSMRSNREQRIAVDFVNMTLLAVEGQRGLGMQRVLGLREQFNGQVKDLKEEMKKIREGYFGLDDALMVQTLC